MQSDVLHWLGWTPASLVQAGTGVLIGRPLSALVAERDKQRFCDFLADMHVRRKMEITALLPVEHVAEGVFDLIVGEGVHE